MPYPACLAAWHSLIAARVLALVLSHPVRPTKGFSSFDAFKRAFGGEGQDRAWHHVVEQHADNVTRFGAESIHTATNMVNIDAKLHAQISAYFSSTYPLTGNTVSEAVKTWSFDDQQRFGNEVMRQIANTRY